MRTRSWLFLSLILVFCSFAPAAQPEKGSLQAALDKKVEALMNKAKSTADQIQAAATGSKLWDEELNRVYQSLLKALPPAGQAALKTAQKSWLAFRDQQFAFIDQTYRQFDGAMYLPMHAHARMSVVRERALDLARFLALQQEHGQ